MRQNAKWLYAIWGDATLSRLVRQTVDMLHLSMLMEVCVLRPGSGSKQLPSAGRAGLYLTLSITTAAKCGSPVWVNMQNHFSRRRFSPGFLFFSFFFSPPRLVWPPPPTRGLILHAKPHHNKFKHGSCSKPEGNAPLLQSPKRDTYVLRASQRESGATLVHSDKRN